MIEARAFGAVLPEVTARIDQEHLALAIVDISFAQHRQISGCEIAFPAASFQTVQRHRCRRQLRIVRQGLFIRYREDALVFDEKVDSQHAFQQQRKRWVSGQFINLKESFFSSLGQLFRGNVSYFNFGVVNNLVLPRAFLFVLLPALVVAGFFISPFWGIASAIVLFAYLFSLSIAIPRVMVNRNLVVALLKLPKAIFVMAGALLQMKKSHKAFIHTVHTKTEISNSLFNDNGK